MSSRESAWADVAELLRTQRKLARLSLRGLARLTNVSDSYLSQVERGLHQPSPDVLKAIARGLGIPATSLYERLGWLDGTQADGIQTEPAQRVAEQRDRAAAGGVRPDGLPPDDGQPDGGQPDGGQPAGAEPVSGVEAAIEQDGRLRPGQKSALRSMYRALIETD